MEMVTKLTTISRFQRDQHTFLFWLKEQFVQDSLGGRVYKKINDPEVGTTEILGGVLTLFIVDEIGGNGVLMEAEGL